MTKAKQVETLIKAMPVPESEETQVCPFVQGLCSSNKLCPSFSPLFDIGILRL